MLRLLYSQSFPAVGKPVFISHSGKIVKKVRRPLDARLDQVIRFLSWANKICDFFTRGFLTF